jgi:hypothetical protein
VPSVSLTSLRSVYEQAFLFPSPPFIPFFSFPHPSVPLYPCRLVVTTPVNGLVVVVPEQRCSPHVLVLVLLVYFCLRTDYVLQVNSASFVDILVGLLNR